MTNKFATRFRPPKSKGLKCGPTMTDGSFESECRIDRILYKYTHNLPLAQWQMKRTEGMFADVTQVPKDPAEAHEWANRMDNLFASLPAEIRREYKDDVGNFVTAIQNDVDAVHKRCDELLEMHAEKLNPEVAKIRRLAKIVKSEFETPVNKENTNNETPPPVAS